MIAFALGSIRQDQLLDVIARDVAARIDDMKRDISILQKPNYIQSKFGISKRAIKMGCNNGITGLCHPQRTIRLRRRSKSKVRFSAARYHIANGSSAVAAYEANHELT